MDSPRSECSPQYETHGEDWARLGFAARAALFLCGLFVAIGLFAISTALPLLEQAFAGSGDVQWMVQLIASSAAPVFALASPLAGRVISRIGVRKLYLASLGVVLVAGLGPIACHSLWQILALRVLLGIGVAGGFVAGMTGIANVPERQRNMLLGLTAFFGGGVSVVAFPLVGWLATMGWQAAFLIHLLLVPLGVFALALPAGNPGTPSDAKTSAAPTVGLFAGLPARLLFLAAMVGWAMVASSLYSPFLLGSIGVDSSASVGTILGVMALCSLGGSGSYGLVQRHLGTRAMLLIAPLFAGAGALLLGLTGSIWAATIGLSLMGVGLGIFGAAGYGAAIEAAGPHGDAGAATGVFNLALYLPQLAFPVLVGAISERFGPAMIYLVLAGMLVIAVAANGIGLPTRRAKA